MCNTMQYTGHALTQPHRSAAYSAPERHTFMFMLQRHSLYMMVLQAATCQAVAQANDQTSKQPCRHGSEEQHMQKDITKPSRLCIQYHTLACPGCGRQHAAAERKWLVCQALLALRQATMFTSEPYT